MQEEFEKGDEKCSALLAAPGRCDWVALLEPFPFFTAFKNYLQVRPHVMKSFHVHCALLNASHGS